MRRRTRQRLAVTSVAATTLAAAGVTGARAGGMPWSSQEAPLVAQGRTLDVAPTLTRLEEHWAELQAARNAYLFADD